MLILSSNLAKVIKSIECFFFVESSSVDDEESERENDEDIVENEDILQEVGEESNNMGGDVIEDEDLVHEEDTEATGKVSGLWDIYVYITTSNMCC